MPGAREPQGWMMAKMDVPVVTAATEKDFVIAEQAIFHDAARPSYVTLPVIPR